MRNDRRRLVFLALALLGTLIPLPEASAASIKGIAYKPDGTVRASAQIFISVKTHETNPTVIGGSEATAITTGTNGSYTVTYTETMLGASKMINITYKLSGSSNIRTIGPISGVGNPPVGFGHVVNAIVPN